MNEEITKKVLEWLDSAASFAASEIPEFASEILRWGMASSIIYMFFELVAIITIIYLIKKFITKLHDEVDVIALFVIGAITTIILSLCFVGELQAVFKIIFAPRLYILDMVIK